MTTAPLVLSQADQDFFHEILLHLLRKSESRCVLLVDESGRCLTRAGSTQKIDTDALSALIAGSFSSTRAMAELVGETAFSVLFHQGQHDHIHTILVDNDRILAVVFDQRTTVGMVRLCAQRAAKQIAVRFREIAQRTGTGGGERIDDEMAEGTSERFDQIFESDES